MRRDPVTSPHCLSNTSTPLQQFSVSNSYVIDCNCKCFSIVHLFPSINGTTLGTQRELLVVSSILNGETVKSRSVLQKHPGIPKHKDHIHLCSLLFCLGTTNTQANNPSEQWMFHQQAELAGNFSCDGFRNGYTNQTRFPDGQNAKFLGSFDPQAHSHHIQWSTKKWQGPHKQRVCIPCSMDWSHGRASSTVHVLLSGVRVNVAHLSCR